MPKYNSYAIDEDQGRNCHSCKGFGHIPRNYRNRKRIRQEKRMKYEQNQNNKHNNLNGNENLIVFDQVLVAIIGSQYLVE